MSGAIPDRHPDLVKREPATWRQRVACFLGFHDWTARIDLGADAKDFVDRSALIPSFFEFAAPVCRHCQTQLPPRLP